MNLQNIIDSIEVDDKKIDYETRGAKTSETSSGRQLSQEHKDKVSNAFKGREAPNKGKNASEQHRKNNSEAQLKRYKEKGINPAGVQKTAEALSPYYFTSPKGRFESLYELDLAYNGEYKRTQLYYLTKKGKNGFGRSPKDTR